MTTTIITPTLVVLGYITQQHVTTNFFIITDWKLYPLHKQSAPSYNTFLNITLCFIQNNILKSLSNQMFILTFLLQKHISTSHRKIYYQATLYSHVLKSYQTSPA